MTMGPLDLSGVWTGVYDYANAPLDAVPFTAALTDVGGVIWGTVTEPNTFPDASRDELEAALNGMRAGREMRFRKEYTPMIRGGELPIDYVGHVSPGGNRIEGKWRIPMARITFGGPFVMNRTGGVSAARELARKATVEVPR